jgi:nitrile hydratase accessory protein
VTRVAPEIANLEGPAALPRKNGELVFEAPWEGRAFGIAVALSENGTYAWDEFRERLVDRIADGTPWYYESWLGALESVLLERGLLDEDELAARAAEFKDLRRDPVF